jgi:hypothetical protein
LTTTVPTTQVEPISGQQVPASSIDTWLIAVLSPIEKLVIAINGIINQPINCLNLLFVPVFIIISPKHSYS